MPSERIKQGEDLPQKQKVPRCEAVALFSMKEKQELTS